MILLFFQILIMIASLPLTISFVKKWKQTRVHKAFILVVLSGFVLALGTCLENAVNVFGTVEDYNAYKPWIVTYIGLCTIASTFIHLAWCYSGRHLLYRNINNIKLLATLTILDFVAVISNHWHHWYFIDNARVEPGFLFYPFFIFSYGGVIYSYLTLRSEKRKKKESTCFINLACLPFVITHVIGLFVADAFSDLMPLSYLFLLLGSFLEIRVYAPIYLSPLVAKGILDNLDSLIYIKDENTNEVYQNKAMYEANFTPVIHESDSIVTLGKRKYLQTTKQPFDKNDIYIFSDITQYVDTIDNINAKKLELQKSKETLDELQEEIVAFAAKEKQAIQYRQQAKLIQRLNDEVSGMLNLLLENTKETIENPQVENIEKNVQLSRECLSVVRQIVSELMSKE